MRDYFASDGPGFGMATPRRQLDAMETAGFVHCEAISRNSWYREQARLELELLKGPAGHAVAKIVTRDFVEKNIAIWNNMIPVLDSGEHCPSHLRACKPHSKSS